MPVIVPAPITLPRTIVIPPERSPEPIAIVGLGCKLPKAHSVSELELLLREGKYAIQEVPVERGRIVGVRTNLTLTKHTAKLVAS